MGGRQVLEPRKAHYMVSRSAAVENAQVASLSSLAVPVSAFCFGSQYVVRARAPPFSTERLQDWLSVYRVS